MPTELFDTIGRKHIEILQVDNGFILFVTGQGESIYNTRYSTPIRVYSSMEELLDEIQFIFRKDND